MNIILNTAHALEMLDGEKGLYAMLMDTYLNKNPFDKTYLESLISQGKLQEAGSYVHKCKGASAQLGAEKLAASAQALEDVLKGKTSGDITALTTIFLDDYNEAASKLREYRTHL